MFTSVVLSLLLQRETGTEIIRSQGSIGFWKRRRTMETSGLKLKEYQESLDLFSTLVDVFLAAKDHRGTNLTQTQVYLKCPQRHTLTGGWSSIVFSFKAPTFLIFLHSFFFPMFIQLTINSLFGVKLCPSYTLDHTVDVIKCQQSHHVVGVNPDLRAKGFPSGH